jgi:hypothetical protein
MSSIPDEIAFFSFGDTWINTKRTKFLQRTVVDNECLLWQGANSGNDSNRYGVFTIAPYYKKFYIHRAILSWKLGRQLEENALHICDRSLCLNESHLYEGTQQQNLMDSLLRGHRSQSRPGLTNGNCRTTVETVLKVRELWDTGQYRKVDIARLLDITDTKVHSILSSGYWM